MSEIENIRDWRGKEVLDSDGERIGDVEDVYFDIETDEPSSSARWLGGFATTSSWSPSEE
jgi:sporulation protein YlmC with PRC-barrel domain